MSKFVAVLSLLILLSACGAASHIASSSPTAAPSQTSSSSPVASPSPAASPVVSPTVPSGFVETVVTGGSASTSIVTDVRIGQHDGYDRFVIEFSGGMPSYSVTPQGNATFTRSPRGDEVTLDGSGGVLIVIHSVTNWSTYTGPNAFQPGYPFLRQALQVENFEGYQQWALGIHGKACIRVAEYSSPTRLVVDVVGI